MPIATPISLPSSPLSSRSKKKVEWNCLSTLQLPNTGEDLRELVLVLEVHRKGEGMLGRARVFVPLHTDVTMSDYPLVQVSLTIPSIACVLSYLCVSDSSWVEFMSAKRTPVVCGS